MNQSTPSTPQPSSSEILSTPLPSTLIELESALHINDQHTIDVELEERALIERNEDEHAPLTPAEKRKHTIIMMVLAVFLVTLVLVANHYKRNILSSLRSLSDWIRASGIWGMALLFIYEMICCFPPMVGFILTQVLTGFIYGMYIGFIPMYLAAVTGSLLCFLLGRHSWRHYVLRMAATYPRLKSLDRAIMKGGFKLVLLVRCAPLPFPYMNVVLSVCHISFPHYAIATIISLIFHVGLHVWIGSAIESADGIIEALTHNAATLPLLVVAIIVGIILSVWIKRLIAEAKEELKQEQMKRNNIMTSTLTSSYQDGTYA